MFRHPFLIVLLIAAVSISPRIDIGRLETGRALQLRYEDFLMVLIFFLWFAALSIKNNNIYVSVIASPLIIYLVLAAVSTSIGIFAGWVNPVMGFFFYAKEMQYFFIFFIVLNLLKTYHDLKIAIWALLACGIANGFYVLYQIFSGQLFAASRGYYGISCIGEPSPFATGGYFLIIFIISSAFFFVVHGKIIKLLCGFSALLALIGLVGSMSRANIIAATFGIFMLLVFFVIRTERNTKFTFAFVTPIVVIPLILLIGTTWVCLGQVFPLGRMTVANIRHSFFEKRVRRIYVPAFKEFAKSPVLGLGKSSTTSFIAGTGEAHNYYLRILIEMGIPGLIAFLYLLISIVKMSLKVYKNSSFEVGKGVGLGCLLVTMSLMVASTAQDAFTPVKVNEFFWMLAGLSGVAYRLSSKEKAMQTIEYMGPKTASTFHF